MSCLSLLMFWLKTHLPIVSHICVKESGIYWFRQWLVAYSAPSHYLNQCLIIVNWTLRNKLQWNFNQNTKLFIHENTSENIVCEMAAILSSGGWVKKPVIVLQLKLILTMPQWTLGVSLTVLWATVLRATALVIRRIIAMLLRLGPVYTEKKQWYRDSHHKPETVWPSQVYNGDSYTR